MIFSVISVSLVKKIGKLMQRNFPVPQNKNVQQLLEKDLTDRIIGAAIEVHKILGPGLLESAYQVCMEHESGLQNIPFQRLVDLPLSYKGINLDAGYVIDLIYDKHVIVELKAVEKVIPVHEAQLLTYMRLTGIRVGLLINFNVPALKDGIYRRVL
jgi:GxxExxY protein